MRTWISLLFTHSFLFFCCKPQISILPILLFRVFVSSMCASFHLNVYEIVHLNQFMILLYTTQVLFISSFELLLKYVWLRCGHSLVIFFLGLYTKIVLKFAYVNGEKNANSRQTKQTKPCIMCVWHRLTVSSFACSIVFFLYSFIIRVTWWEKREVFYFLEHLCPCTTSSQNVSLVNNFKSLKNFHALNCSNANKFHEYLPKHCIVCILHFPFLLFFIFYFVVTVNFF